MTAKKAQAKSDATSATGLGDQNEDVDNQFGLVEADGNASLLHIATAQAAHVAKAQAETAKAQEATREAQEKTAGLESLLETFLERPLAMFNTLPRPAGWAAAGSVEERLARRLSPAPM